MDARHRARPPSAPGRPPNAGRRLPPLPVLYTRIGRTYLAWARPLLVLATIVFVPLGLVSAIPLSLNVDSVDFGSGLVVIGILVAALVLVGTSLVGEVFFSGAVAVALTHSADAGPSALRELSRRLDYRALIAVDLIYSALVIAGLALLVVPGVVLYVWLGLAGPVVEIERHGVRAAFARSARLVRGNFWLVLAVLAPIELASEGIGALSELLAHSLLGSSLWSDWLSESLSNIVATPFFAVAAVLITVELIAARDGSGPRLHSAPRLP
jgi:hypothetical protein